MTNKKNRFWTFCFSLCPGAGEMYMGFYKQGVSLMALFFGLGAMGAWLRLEPLLFFLPVVWFYSFFHVHNLRGLPEEEFCMMEDHFLFEDYMDWEGAWTLSEKKKRTVAVVLIVLGGYFLFQSLLQGTLWFLPDFLRSALHQLEYMLPQVLIGVGIIYVGLRMLKNEPSQGEERGSEEERGDDAE